MIVTFLSYPEDTDTILNKVLVLWFLPLFQDGALPLGVVVALKIQ